jgi:cell division septation protein DedD
MTTQRIHLALAAGLLSTALHAAPNAVVETVQYPAWLERNGQAVPLTPGTVLHSSDKLRTGDNARVQLKMGEGSTVKLGEKAAFVVERVENRGVFRATLNVLTGAFRFTTDALKKKMKRDVSIKAKNVTAGVRGTDLWGKATDEKDVICLFEGKITVAAEGHPVVTMDSPFDFYQKPRDGQPVVAKVTPEQVEKWSAETELARDGAAARAGGRWRVAAGTFSSRDEALALSRRLRNAGYPAQVEARDKAFAVVVPGLAGEADARVLVTSLAKVEGVASPSVEESRAKR